MFNQIKIIYKERIIENCQYPLSFDYYYFYKDTSCQSFFAIKKDISSAEYQLLKTSFIEKKVYNQNQKLQSIYEYLLDNGNNPFNNDVSFIIYAVNQNDEQIVNDIINDIYKDVIIISYLGYKIAFSKGFDEIKSLFTTLSDDIGYEIHVHEGFIIHKETNGHDLYIYLLNYQKHLSNHIFTNIANMIIENNNKDIECLKIIKRNVLSKIIDNVELKELINIFLKENLNVSSTAKLIYMHRNTLLNKLDYLKKQTKLDIQKFNDAFAIKILLDICD